MIDDVIKTGLPTPQISVVVPVYKDRGTLKRAIESALAQTFSSFEIIIVDDGSADPVAAIVAQWGVEELRVITHPLNRGAAAARNTGIAAARGPWIAFLDSDDVWRPDKLARQMALLQRVSNPSVKACVTGYLLHKDGRAQTVRLNLSGRKFQQQIPFGCSVSPGTTLLVDRRMFDQSEIGTFDEELRRLEDWDWLLRFAERYEMESVPEPLADVYFDPPAFAGMEARHQAVIAAIDRIGRKHLTRRFGKEMLQLRSSLLVEKAAALHHTSRPFAAAAHVIAAGFFYPFRNVAFFRAICNSVFELLRRSRQKRPSET